MNSPMARPAPSTRSPRYLVWIATFSAALLVSGAFARVTAHRSLAGPMRILAWLLVVAFIGVLAVMASRQPVAGLAEEDIYCLPRSLVASSVG